MPETRPINYKDLRIIFMGTPEFAVASLDALVKAGCTIVAVVTAPDKPAGRGMKLTESAVKKYAAEQQLPVLQPTRLKDPVFIEQLRELKADLQVVVAFRMLPEIVWNMPPMGTINVHGSLLPQYRGAAPINWAVINGEKQTGVTTFKLQHEIDTGDILLQESMPIGDDETAGEVHDRMKELGAAILVQTIKGIADGTIKEIPQQLSADIKHAPKIFTETGKINWTQSLQNIYNLIRGLSPYPAAFTSFQDKTLKIYKATMQPALHHDEPGTYQTDNKTFLKFAAADGYLHVKELQMEGKKRMLVEDFLRGFRLLLLLIVLGFASCKSSKVVIDKTKLMSNLPSLPESHVNIPVKVYARPLFQKAESFASQEFTSTGWPDYLQPNCGFRYKYRFVRSGFNFSCLNNKLTVVMNGTYQIAGSRRSCVFNQPTSPWISGSCGFGTEPMRKVNIVIGSTLSFNSDYTIRSNTTVEKIQPIDKCTVTLLNTDVTAEVMDSIKSSVNLFGEQLDETLAGLDFEEFIQQAGIKVGKKIPVKNYGYMKINPSGVRIGYLNLVNDTIYTTLGVSGYPEMSSDSTNHNVTTFLPPLNSGNVPGGFIINTNAIYDYTTLDTIINQTLRNRSFKVSGKNVIIKKVHVSGLENNRIEVIVDFAGSKKGSIALSGTPVLDVEKQILSIPDLTYALSSGDLVLNVGKRLFNKRIIRAMREKAYMNVAEIYQKNKPKLDAAMNRPVKDGIFTRGNTTGLRLTGLVIKKDAVMLQASVSGQLSVTALKF